MGYHNVSSCIGPYNTSYSALCRRVCSPVSSQQPGTLSTSQRYLRSSPSLLWHQKDFSCQNILSPVFTLLVLFLSIFFLPSKSSSIPTIASFSVTSDSDGRTILCLNSLGRFSLSIRYHFFLGERGKDVFQPLLYNFSATSLFPVHFSVYTHYSAPGCLFYELAILIPLPCLLKYMAFSLNPRVSVPIAVYPLEFVFIHWRNLRYLSRRLQILTAILVPATSLRLQNWKQWSYRRYRAHTGFR